MPIDVKILKTLDLFANLDYKLLEELASMMNRVKATEGEVIGRRGEPARTFGIVLSGNFMIYSKDGRAYTLHKKGEIMGWSTLIAPFYYTGTAVALTKGEILTLHGEDFLLLIQSNSEAGDKIMKKISPIFAERTAIFQQTN